LQIPSIRAHGPLTVGQPPPLFWTFHRGASCETPEARSQGQDRAHPVQKAAAEQLAAASSEKDQSLSERVRRNQWVSHER